MLAHIFSFGDIKFRGVYGPNMRKLDITYTPYQSWATALLHSTGSKNFNIKMRKIAIDKGFKLNEKGLFTFSGQQIYTPTEADIFSALGLQYVPPDGRNMV
jgi:DNA polymerase (family 10)